MLATNSAAGACAVQAVAFGRDYVVMCDSTPAALARFAVARISLMDDVFVV